MSSSPIPKLNDDFDLVKNHLDQMTATIVVTTCALSEILRCEMSPKGTIEMKAIAENALVQTQCIALKIGGKTNAKV